MRACSGYAATKWLPLVADGECLTLSLYLSIPVPDLVGVKLMYSALRFANWLLLNSGNASPKAAETCGFRSRRISASRSKTSSPRSSLPNQSKLIRPIEMAIGPHLRSATSYGIRRHASSPPSLPLRSHSTTGRTFFLSSSRLACRRRLCTAKSVSTSCSPCSSQSSRASRPISRASSSSLGSFLTTPRVPRFG